MLIVERQRRIVERLRREGAAGIDELAEALEVSPSTVRRDLEALESEGVLARTHGGGVYLGAGGGQTPGEPGHGAGYGAPGSGGRVALAARLAEHVAEKERIGRAAAQLVEPHMTVLMDGGSTIIYAARQIRARPIQVVTNSLSIANHFERDEQVELLLAGGNLYPRTEVTVGPIATAALAALHADLLFFSLAGIWEDAAFNINLPMAEVERVMMLQAAESVMLMDSSKFGRKSLVRVCGLESVGRIITDGGVPPAWRDRLGDRLQVAEA